MRDLPVAGSVRWMLTKCPECGSQMELIETSFTPSSRPGQGRDGGTLGMRSECVNPDCPGNESNLAPRSDESGPGGS